ncbi:MAG TPA: hypothetical protein VJO53_01830 [Candidatus Acidoferrales bacterium]|nr:hypothetical protein [Candidatus Acidoferrales bacterium]
MPNAANLFRLLNECILLLLGALLILLALTRRVGLPGRPLALALVGAILVYWGARALLRREAEAERLQTRIRAGSLLLVGLLVLGIPILPLRDAEFLLGLAGCVLVLRGLVGGALAVRGS